MEPHSRIQPNSTQVPNIILDDWLLRLKDTELRILLIVTRQTLGWVEDTETGRRKEKDWISSSQLEKKSGRTRKHLSKALRALIETYGLIEATNAQGKVLHSADQRRYNFGQIFYRLTLKEPQRGLFETPRASKGRTAEGVGTKGRTQKGLTTKETHITKEIHIRRAKPAVGDKSGDKTQKGISTHTQLIRFFYEAVKTARRINPVFSAVDGKQLKRVLEQGVSQETVEQVMVYFLFAPEFAEFSPTVKTCLSTGVITGILNKMRNKANFWKDMDHYAEMVRVKRDVENNPQKINDIATGLIRLKTALAEGMTLKSYAQAEA